MDDNKSRDNNQPYDRLEWSQTIFQVFQTLALRSLQPTSGFRNHLEGLDRGRPDRAGSW